MPVLEPVNPYSLEKIGSFELEHLQSLEKKVNTLKKSQKTWKSISVESRVALVLEAIKYFEENTNIIANDISEQMGRPLHYANGEINGFFERARFLCSIAEKTLAPDICTNKEGFERSIRHDPLGIVFVISAWNYPLLVTVNSVIPALLAGNTVILKHSAVTPKIGKHFENAFKSMGEFNNLLLNTIIDHETTGAVIETLPIDHVVFTGSVTGGRQILKHTSKRFMQPALELGGKDAVYVHSDADLDYAAETIVDGAMFNSGQSCCGMERAYVHESVYEEFLAKSKKLIDSYKLGDPKKEDTMMGPLANAKSASFMKRQVDEAVKKGASILSGGSIKKINVATFFEATLIKDVNHDMEIMREENFGPILPVMSVSDEKEALDLINDSEYGLTCAVFTQDIRIAQTIAEEAETGTVFMNRCDYLDPELPWTGVKNSGCGSALSEYGFYGVTRRKALHFKTNI